MIGASGQVALLRFPQANLAVGKLRPVLVLARVLGRHDDWLVCMLSSQMHQIIDGFDEAIQPNDEDFAVSGLKVATVARLGRLAVVESNLLEGVLGALSPARVSQIRSRLANWLASN